MCVFAVLALMKSVFWMCSVLRPLAKSTKTSLSRSVSSYCLASASQRSLKGADALGASSSSIAAIGSSSVTVIGVGASLETVPASNSANAATTAMTMTVAISDSSSGAASLP